MKLRLLGKGATASVFQLNRNQAIKVFAPHLGPILAAREFYFANKAFAAGIPTPQPMALTTYETQAAIVFEFCAGRNLDAHTLPRPWRYKAASREMADLHTSVHRVRLTPSEEGAPGVVSQRDLLAMLAGYGNSLPISLMDECMRRIASLPSGDQLCHGDFAPSNIMIRNKQRLVIDWSLGSRGCPEGDFAWTWLGISDLANLGPLPALVKAALRKGAEAYRERYRQRDCAELSSDLAQWLAPVAAARLGALEKVGGDLALRGPLTQLITQYCEA
jgi:aminoglycoside phosphotransferase (APT) family kinase protein